ncbi:TPA: hypothetical protein ACJX8E_001134 [Pseudomonas aeruginosa]
MTESKICTCPSGDGSLVHPCPAHPAVEQADASSCQGTNCGTTTGDHSSECLAEAAAGQGWELKPGDLCGRDCPIHKISVEQAGGDERAEFERAFTVQEGIYFDDKRGEYRSMNLRAIEASDALDLNLRLQGWQARAALAQPSPAQAEQAEAEAERPEVVARVVHSNPVVLGQCGPLNANDELMTVAQHAASVARWAEMFNRVEQQRDAALARVAELESKLAELEKQKPVAYGDPKALKNLRIDGHKGSPYHREWMWANPDAGLIPLYTAPVSQAQQLHDLDKQCRDDVARALGLRPSQERGFAWSYLLTSIKSCVKASEDSAHAQHSDQSELRRIAVALTNPLLNGQEASDLMVRYEALTMPDHIIALIDSQAQYIAPDELRAICMLVAEAGIKYGRGRDRAVASDECREVVDSVLPLEPSPSNSEQHCEPEIMAVAEGVLTFMRSEKEGSHCTCCNGPHIFCRYFEGMSDFDDITRKARFRNDLEGRTFRLVLELLPAALSGKEGV